MRKGFLFTLDALLAFWLIVTLTTSVVVFSEQSLDKTKLQNLNTIGRDYLTTVREVCSTGGPICIVGVKAKFTETHFKLETNQNNLGSSKWVAASMITYQSNCADPRDVACLSAQDITGSTTLQSRVWVTNK
ncbi:hypothetical protein HUU53_03285 [Candidatus Micrarchaeota archaeon]|nr:hypothetical protein [Candidatus Micrarchaeota archaeon]